jgi:acyl-CoA synthetase (AMP-forming)/AMP-acid ligase II
MLKEEEWIRIFNNLIIRLSDIDRCTVVYGTPTMFVDMLNVPNLEQYDVSKLSVAFMGGAPVPEELAKGVSTKLSVQVVVSRSIIDSIGCPRDVIILKIL